MGTICPVPSQLIKTTAGFLCCPQIALPLAGAGIAYQQQAQPVAIGLLVSAGVLSVVFLLWRRHLALVTRLLGVSAHGLAANPGVVLLTLLLQVRLGRAG